MDAVEIPDKLYFKIGEVADIVGVKPHVLRYWESEFPAVKPVKSHGKQRLYRKNHILQLLQLKELLHHQGFTLAGAKKQLKTQPAAEELPLFTQSNSSTPPNLPNSSLDEIRRDLRRLRQSLD